MAESGEGAGGQAAAAGSPGARPALSNHPLLSSDFTRPKQGLHASAALSLSGWTWSPRSEGAGAVGSRCGSRGPRRLLGGRVDVGPRQWGWVEGHGHGGSHSGEALGQRGRQPPPEPSCSWSWGTQGLGALLVHLYHLGRDTGPGEPRAGASIPSAPAWCLAMAVGKLGPCWPPAGYDTCQGTDVKAWGRLGTLLWTLKAKVGSRKKPGEVRGRPWCLGKGGGCHLQLVAPHGEDP